MKGKWFAAVLALSLLAGCTAAPLETTPPETTLAATTPPATLPVTTPQATIPPETTPPAPTVPETTPFTPTNVHTGEKVEQCDVAVVDYSNAQQGYIMACYTAQTQRRLKAQVKGPGTTYTFNLTPGQWAAFPLAEGDGKYRVNILENVKSNKYALVMSVTVEVTLEDEFAPFLHSNQFVNYDEAPQTVEMAWQLCRGLAPLEKVEKVYEFVVNGMTYDHDLAASVKSGYVPVLDSVLERMTGICFDYAALMTGMLRSQGVPCKLVVGYAGDIYHAWISVWSEDTGWVEAMVFFDGNTWKRMDPTFASSADGDPEILEYILDDTHYKAKYIY